MEHKKMKKKKEEEETFRVWILWKNYKRRINFVTTVPRFPLNTPSTSVPREGGTESLNLATPFPSFPQLPKIR